MRHYNIINPYIKFLNFNILGLIYLSYDQNFSEFFFKYAFFSAIISYKI